MRAGPHHRATRTSVLRRLRIGVLFGLRCGSSAAITHTVDAKFTEATRPARSGAHRHLEPPGSPAAAVGRPLSTQWASGRRQVSVKGGITVGHKDLRSELVRSSTACASLRRPPYFTTPRVPNVQRQNADARLQLPCSTRRYG
jgi:hypothetical protein